MLFGVAGSTGNGFTGYVLRRGTFLRHVNLHQSGRGSAVVRHPFSSLLVGSPSPLVLVLLKAFSAS